MKQLDKGMQRNIYRKILDRFYKNITASGKIVKADSSDLTAVIIQFGVLEARVEYLEKKIRDTLTGIKKVLQIP